MSHYLTPYGEQKDGKRSTSATDYTSTSLCLCDVSIALVLFAMKRRCVMINGGQYDSLEIALY